MLNQVRSGSGICMASIHLNLKVVFILVELVTFKTGYLKKIDVVVSVLL